jgi:type VI secretion system protein ImpC
MSATANLTGYAAPSLVDDMLAQARLRPDDAGFAIVRAGVGALLRELGDAAEPQRIDRAVVDRLIAELDRRLSQQLDEILHHPAFQRLEAAWRGLKFLVDRTDFRENIRIELCPCSKGELARDFADAPERAKSGLYRLLYASEYGTFGGKPFGAVIAAYELGPGPQDLALLGHCAAVATMAHAPIIAAAAPSCFGLGSFEGLPALKDLRSVFEGPQYAAWQSFREREDARSVGLCLPRFLLRLPYGPETTPTREFEYRERAAVHETYLWGNAAFALASRLCDSFARYRWCPNIIGPQSGGAVPGLPLHQFRAMGELQTKIPTEILITERRECELSDEGFIPLVARKGSDDACFFSAPSCQKPKGFGQSEEGRAAELNYRLSTQLPYLFIVTRLAHYIKVMQREQIGAWKERADLERELGRWIRQYVADMDSPSRDVRARRPLREAQIAVAEVPGEAGWYRVDLKVRPHFKYMGAFFTLSLVGRLEKQ